MTEALSQTVASGVELIRDYEWFAGIDWASRKHDVVMHDVLGRRVGEATFEHTGAGIAALADWLVATGGTVPHRIAVAIERPDGPVVEMLLERGFPVHAINPKQLDRFRDRFSPAGAKDDRRDGDVLASALRTDAHAFRRLAPDEAVIIELREWRRMADMHRDDLVRQINRLDQVLIRYYPAFRQLDGETDTHWKLALLELAPTPEAARHVPRAKVRRLLQRHRVRVHDTDAVLAIIRSRPIELPAASVRAASTHALALVKSIRFTAEQLDQAERAVSEIIDQLRQHGPDDGPPQDPGQGGGQNGAGGASASQPPARQPGRPSDAAILLSLPGHGEGVLASLLTNAYTAICNRDRDALRCLGGVAPVTRQSGKSRRVVRRYACNRRVQEALFHWARSAIKYDPVSKAKFAALRQRGKTFGHALRAIADRLLYVACTLLENGTLYDPDHTQKATLPA